MKRIFILLIIVLSASLLDAQVPNNFSWQGILQDSEGINLSGDYDITIKIFNSETGGETIWSETHTDYTIDNGFVTLIIGSVTPFDFAFDSPYWLEITIGDDDPLERMILTSVPYALNTSSSSNVIVGYSLVIKDSEGNIRFVLNPETGTFKMMDNDTVWYSLVVNSPAETRTVNSDGTTTVVDRGFSYIVNTKTGDVIFNDGKEYSSDHDYSIATQTNYDPETNNASQIITKETQVNRDSEGKFESITETTTNKSFDKDGVETHKTVSEKNSEREYETEIISYKGVKGIENRKYKDGDDNRVEEYKSYDQNGDLQEKSIITKQPDYNIVPETTKKEIYYNPDGSIKNQTIKKYKFGDLVSEEHKKEGNTTSETTIQYEKDEWCEFTQSELIMYYDGLIRSRETNTNTAYNGTHYNINNKKKYTGDVIGSEVLQEEKNVQTNYDEGSNGNPGQTRINTTKTNYKSSGDEIEHYESSSDGETTLKLEKKNNKLTKKENISDVNGVQTNKTTLYDDDGNREFVTTSITDQNTQQVSTKVEDAGGNSSTETQSPDGSTFTDDRTVEGNHSVGGSSSVGDDQTVGGDQDVLGNSTIGADQTVGGDQDVEGNVVITGNLTVNGTKNFGIDYPFDPENKYLFHAAMESNEVLNQYSGNVTTDGNGNAIVELPNYFEEINIDFRYQLTVVGQFAQAIISSKISDNSFEIKTDKPNVEVSWQVTARRNDTYMRENPYEEVRMK